MAGNRLYDCVPFMNVEEGLDDNNADNNKCYNKNDNNDDHSCTEDSYSPVTASTTSSTFIREELPDWEAQHTNSFAYGGKRSATVPAKFSSSSLLSTTNEIPSSFICPIALEVMIDPVTDYEGNTYDRKNIVRWISQQHLQVYEEYEAIIPRSNIMLPMWNNVISVQSTIMPSTSDDVSNTEMGNEDGHNNKSNRQYKSPITRNIIKREQLIPNHSLRKMIYNYMGEDWSNRSEQRKILLLYGRSSGGASGCNKDNDKDKNDNFNNKTGERKKNFNEEHFYYYNNPKYPPKTKQSETIKTVRKEEGGRRQRLRPSSMSSSPFHTSTDMDGVLASSRTYRLSVDVDVTSTDYRGRIDRFLRALGRKMNKADWKLDNNGMCTLLFQQQHRRRKQHMKTNRQEETNDKNNINDTDDTDNTSSTDDAKVNKPHDTIDTTLPLKIVIEVPEHVGNFWVYSEVYDFKHHNIDNMDNFNNMFEENMMQHIMELNYLQYETLGGCLGLEIPTTFNDNNNNMMKVYYSYVGRCNRIRSVEFRNILENFIDMSIKLRDNLFSSLTPPSNRI